VSPSLASTTTGLLSAFWSSCPPGTPAPLLKEPPQLFFRDPPARPTPEGHAPDLALPEPPADGLFVDLEPGGDLPDRQHTPRHA
jgi:hypothetical protein